MRKTQWISILALGLLIPGGSVFARNSPTHIRPTPGGGYTISRPGERPTYVRPTPGGGKTITRP